MTQQSSNYRYGDRERTVESRMTAAGERARELGEEALDRADAVLRPVGLSIRERPMTCLAVVGGVAFAAGAVWMLRAVPAGGDRPRAGSPCPDESPTTA